jgi:hypothetical protein
VEEVIFWQLAAKGLYCFPEDGAAEFFKENLRNAPRGVARMKR